MRVVFTIIVFNSTRLWSRQMRVVFTIIVFLLGLNLIVDLSNSNLIELLNERQQQIENVTK